MSTFKKSSLRWWWLFDFANSIPVIIGGMYFSKWFINDIGSTPIMYNLIFFASSLLIIFLGRYIGKKVDEKGYQSWIKIAFEISVISLFGLVLASQTLSGNWLIGIAFLLFMAFLFGYQMGRICHNSYLRGHIPEEQQSKMSGLGTVANRGGSIFGILIALPVVKLFDGQLGHEMALVVWTVAYALLTPIAISLMSRSQSLAMVHISKETIDTHTRKSVLLTSGMLLLMYFLLFETMITVERNLPPYLTSIFQLGNTVQSLAFLAVVLCALFGGLIASKVVQFSTARKRLRIGSFALVIGIILITVPNEITMRCSAIIAGLAYGILETAIRTDFMGNFSPKHAGQNFGILAMTERTSGTIWPLLWIIPFSFLGERSAYLVAMRLMAGLALIAFGLLMRKKE